MNKLRGKVAVVAGATRGSGRGIARMLGAAGALVYCTGRSTRGQPWQQGPYAGRPENIEETAELVTAAGGQGIAVRVDHSEEKEVRALFDRVCKEQGRLDVLASVMTGDPVWAWNRFWKLSVLDGRFFLDSWIWKHLITFRHAAPIMIEQKSGLIVQLTEGDSLGYSPNLYWDLVKTVLARSVYVMAEELAEHEVTALTLTPGYLRSEYMLEKFGVSEANWRVACEQDPNFAASETPGYVGRAVVALAADVNVQSKTGGQFSSWGLAEEYGFTDVDGTRPNLAKQLGDFAFGRPRISKEWVIAERTDQTTTQ